MIIKLIDTMYEYENKDDVPFEPFIFITWLLYVLLAIVPGTVASNFDSCLFLHAIEFLL